MPSRRCTIPPDLHPARRARRDPRRGFIIRRLTARFAEGVIRRADDLAGPKADHLKLKRATHPSPQVFGVTRRPAARGRRRVR